ncbi:MAG: glutathione S-transferase family protein, partial [Arenicellales bacterium]
MAQTQPQTLKLISFNICPFVQRSVILLNEKGVDYDLDYIDVKNKPDWFLEISPLGKVPVLVADNTSVFESAVISEYIDETHAPSHHPQDPLQKALHRAWVEFGSTLTMA